MRSEGFVYRGRSAEDVDQQANQSGSSYDKFINDRFPTWKVEKGDRIVRILPPTFNVKKYGKHWGLKCFIHRNVGAKDGQYLCLEEMKGEECPICEFAKALEADGETDDAYKLRKQFLYIAWAIDRDDEKAGPLIWTVPWTLDREIGVRSNNKKTGEVILIDSPEEGFDVEFRREGTGLGTKYIGVNISRDASALSDNSKRQAKWLAFVQENPLNEVLHFYDADYLEGVVTATSADTDDDTPKKKKKPKKGDDDDEDEDETPKRGRPKKKPADEDEDEDETPPPKKKKKPVVEEDEEDEPDGGDDDDEDEDEDEPAPKSKPKKKKPVDDDDEDEDEDEAPTPPRKPVKKKKPADDEDEDEDDEDSSASAKAALKKVGKKKKPAADDEDEDEDEGPKAKVVKKKKRVVEEDDEDEDDD